MSSNLSTTFSSDYASARKRFRQAATNLGWELEAHSIGLAGPNGDDLTFDVACSPGGDTNKVLVISSGLHGVEGFFGSAVQVALLEQWASEGSIPTKCVFLHGLNPFGFAWLRRFDENNIDPNRNFLLPDERFEGAPEGYASLDAFLNPCRPPSRWEPFIPQSLWLILRHGMPALRQAIAGGQYEFPRGLFFGGKGPSRTQQILGENMPRWLKGSECVVHLDFHTGLGPLATCKLLIDYHLDETQRRWLTEWFGSDSYEACSSNGISYNTRGGFARWCVSRQFARHYLFACAEFGTYGPLKVLAGLRAENMAHQWSGTQSESAIRTKQRLTELFCPASENWRSKTINLSRVIVEQALQGLTKVDPR